MNLNYLTNIQKNVFLLSLTLKCVSLKVLVCLNNQIYCQSVDKLAKMPQKAFDEICDKVRILDDKGYKIDSINPNNLIVDVILDK